MLLIKLNNTRKKCNIDEWRPAWWSLLLLFGYNTIQYSNLLWVSWDHKRKTQATFNFAYPHLPSLSPEQTGFRNCGAGTVMHLLVVFCSSLWCFLLLLASFVCIFDRFFHGHNPSQSPKVGSEEENLSQIGENFQQEISNKPWLEGFSGAVFFVKSLEVVDKVNELFVFRVVFVQAAVASSLTKGNVNLLRQRLRWALIKS